MGDRRIESGLDHGRHRAVTFLEALCEFARFVTVVPVKSGRVGQALCHIEAQGIKIGEEHQHAGDGLAGLDDAKLTGLLQRSREVCARIGERNHLRA